MGNTIKATTTGLGDVGAKWRAVVDNGDEMTKRAVYEGAKITANEVKARLKGTLGKYATGKLVKSLGIANIQCVKMYADTSIGFDGYDAKGVPNQLKARALESGTSKQPARPFVRPAVNSCREEAEAAMAAEFKKQLNNKVK
nr:MAG TPA: hypothetical protein [Caudoviricetes sp.]